ncbi:Hsp70 family protein [Corynebacterium aquilae]|uniref:Hsp70 family protein n=1 Tax=Corynebacterium aquilae TaxID=203263 RepID=UPI000A0220E8|nr:Hsp70 family protein [Corynebacterium aquilae]
MSTSDWTLGIDFGTSNTAAAHESTGEALVETINLSNGNNTMPSSVYMESLDAVETGESAIAKAEVDPKGFIPAPKRLIAQQSFHFGGVEVPSSVPVAAVLSAVVQKAVREHGGNRPAQLVLTHPEAWSESEIRVLLEAAQSLGLGTEHITTVSEPQAAAHYYSAARKLEPGEKIAVFDFGGGTLDVAVLEAQSDESFKVIAARGSNAIGGKTFDALLRKWVDRQLEDNNPELLEYLRKSATLAERFALEDSVRRAKELLSESASATVNVATDSFDTERLQISRSEFEALIAPVLAQAVNLTRAALSDAGIAESDDLVALYLTGGSSRIPVVQEEMKSVGPVVTLDDPKTVVVQGALVAARRVVRGVAATDYQGSHPGGEQPESLSSSNDASQETNVLPVVNDVQREYKPVAEASPKRRVVLALGILLVLLLVGLGGFVWSKNSGSEGAVQGHADGEQASVEPAGDRLEGDTLKQANHAEEPGDVKASYVAKIPAALKGDLADCKYHESTSGKAVKCALGGVGVKEFSESGGPLELDFFIDKLEAMKKAGSIRDDNVYGINGEPALILDTGDPKTFARIVNSGSAYTLEFSNLNEVFSGSVSGFVDRDAAQRFADSSSLI